MKNIEDVNILVIGDVMLDHTILGAVDRISPEAPVPIVNVTKQTYQLGGAGNVVRNIREIGANVTLFSQVGNDETGKLITNLLEQTHCSCDIYVNDNICSTKKTRIMSEFREIQMLRYDEEKIYPYNGPILWRDTKYDLIVISDYAKGMITTEIMDKVREVYIPIIVDPKPKNISLYNEAYIITPNEKEFDEILKNKSLPFVDYILNTVGKNGMFLYNHFYDPYPIHIPTDPIQVFNVTGAGDVALAVLSVCISMGYSILESAKIANKCANYTVQQPGTSIVPKELFNSLLK